MFECLLRSCPTLLIPRMLISQVRTQVFDLGLCYSIQEMYYVFGPKVKKTCGLSRTIQGSQPSRLRPCLLLGVHFRGRHTEPKRSRRLPSRAQNPSTHTESPAPIHHPTSSPAAPTSTPKASSSPASHSTTCPHSP